ncbi:hypothetical protein DPMN_129202 [Dreissena polymorpha]|uniref:Uncharacterized protein n=1 Tax=Dreissena polymorpha TaxID=45954 RepID=A0A9D4JX52_DREPO|nr:hypothetical protein DPMN_129202 [Dreissena polymorpha]
MRRDFAGRGYFGPLMKYFRGIGGSPSPPHFLKRIYTNLRSDIRGNLIRGNPRKNHTPGPKPSNGPDKIVPPARQPARPHSPI